MSSSALKTTAESLANGVSIGNDAGTLNSSGANTLHRTEYVRNY